MIRTRRNPQNHKIEFFDTETGTVVSTRTQAQMDRQKKKTYLRRKGTQRRAAKVRNKLMLDKALFKLICTEVANGGMIGAILKKDGMPDPNTFYRWIHENPEMREEYQLAKEFNTHYLADEALQVARESDKSTVLQDRLRVDTLKWRAEVTNPRDYGKQTKIVGDKESPVTFLIDTGIRREEPKIIEDKSEDEGT